MHPSQPYGGVDKETTFHVNKVEGQKIPKELENFVENVPFTIDKDNRWKLLSELKKTTPAIPKDKSFAHNEVYIENDVIPLSQQNRMSSHLPKEEEEKEKNETKSLDQQKEEQKEIDEWTELGRANLKKKIKPRDMNARETQMPPHQPKKANFYNDRHDELKKKDEVKHLTPPKVECASEPCLKTQSEVDIQCIKTTFGNRSKFDGVCQCKTCRATTDKPQNAKAVIKEKKEIKTHELLEQI